VKAIASGADIVGICELACNAGRIASRGRGPAAFRRMLGLWRMKCPVASAFGSVSTRIAELQHKSYRMRRPPATASRSPALSPLLDIWNIEPRVIGADHFSKTNLMKGRLVMKLLFEWTALYCAVVLLQTVSIGALAPKRRLARKDRYQAVLDDRPEKDTEKWIRQCWCGSKRAAPIS